MGTLEKTSRPFGEVVFVMKGGIVYKNLASRRTATKDTSRLTAMPLHASAFSGSEHRRRPFVRRPSSYRPRMISMPLRIDASAFLLSFAMRSVNSSLSRLTI